MNNTLMTVDDVADYCHVPRTTVYRWNRTGCGPPSYRVGKYVRYERSEVESWVKSRKSSGVLE